MKILKYIPKSKSLRVVLAIVLIVIVYFGYKRVFGTNQATSYVLASVEKGTILSSVSASGQVSASDQIDIKPKVSGDVTYVGIKDGQTVGAGQVLVYLDASSAQRAVRDAQISLDSAKIALQKLQHDQQSSSQTTVDSLNQSYKDGYNKVSEAFLSLPNLIELARSVVNDNNIVASGCSNVCEFGNLAGNDFRAEILTLGARAETDYQTAKDAYDSNFATYRDLRLDATPDQVVNIIKTTQTTSELTTQAIKSEQNLLDTLVSDLNATTAKQSGSKAVAPTQVTAYQTSISSAIGSLNSILSNLYNARQNIESAQRALDDHTISNPIDIASQENVVAQKQAALQDAQANLADYAVRSPFAGTLTKISVKKGDSVSGASVLATLITKQSIAEVSLNEVDVAKIKIGQKATLTFDAIDGLSITGEVAEIDAIGTVTQGVVNYGVKIGFDTQDSRIKPGMSVSAAIITDVKQDVLLVPNSAVKALGTSHYVEMLDRTVAPDLVAAGVTSTTTPNQQTVGVGLSNDTSTEITSGLKEGDQVVIKTVTATKTATAQAPSLFGAAGGRGAAGAGGIRTNTSRAGN